MPSTISSQLPVTRGFSSSKRRRRWMRTFLLTFFTLGLCSTLLFIHHLQGRVLLSIHVDYSFEPVTLPTELTQAASEQWASVTKELGDFLSSSTTTSAFSTTAATESSHARAAVSTTTEPATTCSCLRHNSQQWLESPRLGNLHNPNETKAYTELVQSLVLDLPQALAAPGNARAFLEQTITYNTSRFVNDTESATDPQSVRLWSVRLAYLSIMFHQHRPALQEAQARRENSPICPAQLEEYQMGPYDYECPQAKYLVAPLSANGLGVNVRAGTSTLLMAGLISNRTVLLVGHSPVGNKYLQRPWKLASCDRHDAQCFFLPTSPCVPTLDDLSRAYDLTARDRRQLLRRGQGPADHEHDPVWTLTLDFVPMLQATPLLNQALHATALELIAAVPESDPRLPALKLAADQLLEQDEKRAGYNFAAANLKINHALGFYFLRPNLASGQKLDAVMEEILPADLNPETAVGLPVRASDKCAVESECLSFAQYMQATTEVWQQHQVATGETRAPTVVFTTESRKMLADQQAFSESPQPDFLFAFRFVSNHKDVTPDTGSIKQVQQTKDFTEDENMLSVIASLKLQLFPRLSLGNCCSNFHVLMHDFLSEGLGAASENSFQCMQEMENPALRICCGWHHDCQAQKAQAVAKAEAVLAAKTA